MKQISIYPAILKSKVMADGSHRVRIAVSFRNETKYILTRFTVPSDRHFKRGEVVSLPTANQTNRLLREKVNSLYSIYDTIPNPEVLTCGEVLEILKNGGLGSQPLLHEVAEEWIASKRIKPSSVILYRKGYRYAEKFFGEHYNLSLLTPSDVNRYAADLKKKLNNTTLTIKMDVFRCVVAFAIKRGLVSYRIDPFIDYRRPPKNIRNVALTIDQLRKLRDADIPSSPSSAARDYFMFSFYTCGMTYIDFSALDISKPVVRFRRAKTANRRGEDEWTVFTMQPEARAIADRSIKKDRLVLSPYYTKGNLQYLFSRHMEILRFNIIPDCPRLIMYSARKTFAQLAAELFVPDSIIEYCLGDVPSQSKTISFYRKITQEMADKEIRKVLDFVASDMTLQEYLKKC